MCVIYNHCLLDLDLHDSLKHFLWVGVKQSVNIMATGGSDFLHEDKNKQILPLEITDVTLCQLCKELSDT